MSDSAGRERPHRIRLAAAAAASPERLLETWAAIEAEGDIATEDRHFAAECLVGMARPDEALKVLAETEAGVRTDQLRALALDRRGEPGDRDAALEILVGLRMQDALDGETGGMLGGRYKRRGRDQGDRGQLEAALDVYRETWLDTKDTYPGINAAALSLELEGPEASRALAKDVLAALDHVPVAEVNHWTHATRGEAHLLLGDLDEARRWYRKAVASDPNAVGGIVSMRDQARVNLVNLGESADALDDVFTVRTVAAFTGHMLDAEDRPTPRFPRESEGVVRERILERLRALNVGFGFSSAARGGDILFLEELLGRGGSALVVLPFPAEAFIETSVGNWAPRFRSVLTHPRVGVEVILDAAPADADMGPAFAECNRVVREKAVQIARRLGGEPTLIAVWDGRPQEEAGGTAHAVADWLAAGLRCDVIAPNDEARGDQRIAPGVEPPTDPAITPADQPRMDPEGGAPVALPSEDEAAPLGERPLLRKIVGGERSVSSTEPGGYGRRVCLSIGITGYTGEAWRPLPNAERDALDVGEVLERLHGFETHYLMGAEATGDAIAYALQDDLPARVSADDLVVVYFAGHGHTLSVSGEQQGFIVPVDAHEQRLSRLIKVDYLSDWSADLPCRHLLYIFDSCFSGSLVRTAGTGRRTPDPNRARLAITAGKADEVVLDGPPGGNSPFATTLIEALRTGAPGGDGYFTANELASFVERGVRRRLEGGPGQTPTLAQLKDHDGGVIIFRSARQP